MFIPIHDRNPLKSIPFQYVTVALIAINVLIYLLFLAGIIPEDEHGTATFALIPSELLTQNMFEPRNVMVSAGSLPVPERLTLVTYMFMHGNLIHLTGNMLFLWVFGDNVEDAMGHVRFIMFYVMCGIFAGMVHAWVMPNSEIPLIGASGAVAGVIAAYLILHPRVKIWVLALWRIPIRVTAAWALGFWVLLQLFYAFTATDDNVAWWAHVGGLAAGAVLIMFMRRPGVPLFDKTQGGA